MKVKKTEIDRLYEATKAYYQDGSDSFTEERHNAMIAAGEAVDSRIPDLDWRSMAYLAWHIKRDVKVLYAMAEVLGEEVDYDA